MERACPILRTRLSLTLLLSNSRIRDKQRDQNAEPDLLAAMLRHQQQEAIAAQDFDQYVEIEQKLQLLDELVVTRLEREARQWEAQVRIQTAQHQLSRSPSTPDSDSQPTPKKPWTDKSLKAEYKTLTNLYQTTRVKAKTWEKAAQQMNQAL